MIRKQVVNKRHFGLYGIIQCNSCGSEEDYLYMISAIRKQNQIEVESIHSLFLCERCLDRLRKELNS